MKGYDECAVMPGIKILVAGAESGDGVLTVGGCRRAEIRCQKSDVRGKGLGPNL